MSSLHGRPKTHCLTAQVNVAGVSMTRWIPVIASAEEHVRRCPRLLGPDGDGARIHVGLFW